MRWLAALVLLATPAGAGEILNEDAVLTCLADPATRAGDCGHVLQAPCARMARVELARVCLYRLRMRWDEALDREVRVLASALPRDRAAELVAEAEGWRDTIRRECGRIGVHPALKDPETASATRNRCRITWTALFWSQLKTDGASRFEPRLHGE